MRTLATQYAVGQLLAGAIMLTLALVWDNHYHEKKRKHRGPWDK